MIYEIERIRIDGQDFAIKWIDEQEIPLANMGQVNYGKQLMTIAKSSEQNDISTLLHEIMHVINENRLGGKLAEAEIESVAKGLSQVLLDNQDMTMQMAMQGVEFEDEGEQEDEAV